MKRLYKLEIIALILSALIGLNAMFISANGLYDNLFLNYFNEIRVVLINILIIYGVILILSLLTNQLWLSFFIVSIFVNLFSFVNFNKIIYRSEPLYFSDFELINEAGTMAKKYNLNLLSINAIMLYIGILITFLVSFYLFNHRKSFYVCHRFKKIIFSILVYGLFINFFIFDYDLYHKLGKATGLDVWNSVEGYESKGFVYSFTYSIKSTMPYKYKNYNKKQAQDVLNNYSYIPLDEDKKISIMGFMLESFKDFHKYESEKLIFEKNPYEYFEELRANSLHGSILVNSFGGGTFLTETNFLTGYKNNPTYNKPVDTYLRYFKNEGYKTLAFHPNTGSFYNRNNAYEKIGFDEFYEYDNTYSKIDKNLLMNDRFFPEVIRVFDENIKTSPVFSFGVTYESHGPYDSEKPMYDTAYIKWQDSYNKADYTYFNNYLYTIDRVSQSIKILTEYLNSLDKPVILILFGDHSPSMGEGMSIFKMFGINVNPQKAEGIVNIYETPYVVWGNNKAKEVLGYDFNKEGEILEPALLMPYIMKELNLGGSEYLNAMKDLINNMTVIKEHFFRFNGNYVGDPNEDEKKLIHEYRNLEYYNSHKK